MKTKEAKKKHDILPFTNNILSTRTDYFLPIVSMHHDDDDDDEVLLENNRKDLAFCVVHNTNERCHSWLNHYNHHKFLLFITVNEHRKIVYFVHGPQYSFSSRVFDYVGYCTNLVWHLESFSLFENLLLS